MAFCSTCGNELQLRYLEHEGEIPFCEHCQEFRFPNFNTAVSMIVLNPTMDKILLIQQYGRPFNILVAGYVDKGEALEEALIRELQEEIGRKVVTYQYMKSEYFDKSNTVICNFAVVIDSEDLSDVSEWEIDAANWFSLEEAKDAVKPASLAQRFLLYYLAQRKAGNLHV